MTQELKDERASVCRSGFEAQRQAGINVDWFTWQIAWHDARAAQPPSAEGATLPILALRLARETLVQNGIDVPRVFEKALQLLELLKDDKNADT